jgi:putative glycosyltransferase (TIGR04348 family)
LQDARQSRLRIALVTPAAAHARNGNRNTATRWAAFLRDARHRVTVEQRWSAGEPDMLVALHARRSYDSIARFAERFAHRPLVVVLTGTDLYRDLPDDAHAQRSIALATRLVVLQDAAVDELASTVRSKTRVIYQSARKIERQPALRSCFEIVVSGHLRAEKDPFRAAAAAAHLPASSRIRITHVGRALSADMESEAQAWMAREPRYRWLGELAHARALRVLARSRAMVISSRMEGGANVVSEALSSGVPVIASRVSGNIGMLGRDYAGYYPVGDERALARSLERLESEAGFYSVLEGACRARAALVAPEGERAALEALVAELTPVRA